MTPPLLSTGRPRRIRNGMMDPAAWCKSRGRSRIEFMTSFSIDLADDTASALREIAEETAETPDTLIRRAVEELVADYIDGRIAMQRLADPSDPMISSEELRRRLAED